MRRDPPLLPIGSQQPQSRSNQTGKSQARIALKRVKTLADPTSAFPRTQANPLRPPTQQRRCESLDELPLDTESLLRCPPTPATSDESAKSSTVLYLAYGSNLSIETFRGSRGIKPLSQVNVVVPDLSLTFDLPGIPYSEPCFANTKYRTSSPVSVPTNDDEKSSLSPRRSSELKARWTKGLVGVVYEVTLSDYAHIIATEGGGAAYQDILIPCYELPSGTVTVPPEPSNKPFKAHTLFAPAVPPDQPPPSDGGRVSRPDPDYAQPSARYLGLLTTGAEELGLPGDYKEYLGSLRAYHTTSTKQRLGRYIFLTIWTPILLAVFALSGMFDDENGKSPAWLVTLAGALFKGIWASYDGFFKGLFGDGERTVEKDDDEQKLSGTYGAIDR
ncbi:hypothetical protein MMC20_002960 [Loxospora ochrophaea]|nr:hypothetical protein [Loxospora ochrophaea]